jgi:hypothetical protein
MNSKDVKGSDRGMTEELLPGGTEEHTTQSQSQKPVSRPRFEPSTSRLQSSVTCSVSFLLNISSREEIVYLRRHSDWTTACTAAV